MSDVFYRLRIRNLADSSDDLVITSVRGGTNPYILDPPSGDGESFNPVTCETTSASYTCTVIDAVTGANTRVVTAALADAAARQQLLSRKAYIEESVDAVAWTQLTVGWITAIRLASPVSYAITVGETRRVEATREIFKTTLKPDGTPVLYFNNVTQIIGGPVRGTWGPIRNLGGYVVKVNQINATYKYVQLKLVNNGGFDPRAPFTGRFNQMPNYLAEYLNQITRPSYKRDARWRAPSGSQIQGYFPKFRYRVEKKDGTAVAEYIPVAEPQGANTPEDLFTRSGVSSFWLSTIETPWNSSLYPVGTELVLYMYSTEISEDNPLHIIEHPVDLREKLWQAAGIPYDASVLPALKEAIGPDLKLMLRITQSYKLLDFTRQVIDGPFRLATRMDDQGRLVLFSAGTRPAAVPAKTLALADLLDPGTAFDLDQSTSLSKITFRQQQFVAWPEGASGDPPVDGIIQRADSVEVKSDDPSAAIGPEISFEIPGTVTTLAAPAGVTAPDFFTVPARQLFERFGRGAIAGEFPALRGFDAVLGEEIYLNLPHLPVAVVGQSPASQRGGQRIVQVVRRTKTPSGPVLRVIDSGTDAQPSLLPTFTLTLDAGDPRKFATIAITNGPALATAGLYVLIEFGTGASAPAAGYALAYANPATETTFKTPAMDAGTKVWVRMRSMETGKRPSNWTAWTGLLLTALDAPTGVIVAAENVDEPYRRLITWTPGANAADTPVEIRIRKTADPSNTEQLAGLVLPGVNQFELRMLEAAGYTVRVRHREIPPANGVSADVTVTLTVSTTVADPLTPTAEGYERIDPKRVEYAGGGVPNGISGTRAALIAAFDEAGIIQKEVVLREGTWLVNDPVGAAYNSAVKIQSDTHYRGSGNAILKRPAGSKPIAIIANEGFDVAGGSVDNLTFEGITFDGNGANQNLGAWSSSTTYAGGDTVTYGGTSWSSLVNGNLNHAPATGAYWREGYNEFRHCLALLGVRFARFINCRFINGAGDYVFIGNTYDGTTLTARSKYIRFSSCEFIGNTMMRNAITVADGSYVITDPDCVFVDCTSIVNPAAVDLEPDRNDQLIEHISIEGTFVNCRAAVQIFNQFYGAVIVDVDMDVMINGARTHGVLVVAQKLVTDPDYPAIQGIRIRGIMRNIGSAVVYGCGVYGENVRNLDIDIIATGPAMRSGTWLAGNCHGSRVRAQVQECTDEAVLVADSSGVTVWGGNIRDWDNNNDDPGVGAIHFVNSPNWQAFGNFVDGQGRAASRGLVADSASINGRYQPNNMVACAVEREVPASTFITPTTKDANTWLAKQTVVSDDDAVSLKASSVGGRLYLALRNSVGTLRGYIGFGGASSDTMEILNALGETNIWGFGGISGVPQATIDAVGVILRGIVRIVSLAISGNVTVGGNCAITGDVTVGGTCAIAGQSSSDSHYTAAGINVGSAQVRGGATVGTTLGVSGITTSGGLHSTEDVDFDGAMNVDGNSTMHGTAQVVLGFGCNGKGPQPGYPLSAGAYDLASVITLANELRAMSQANGTGS